MIINTGQRTDIPAFYPEWFANRLREGFVMVRNPYNPLQVSRYRLDREVVDAIGFCSKNPGPFFKYMDLLDGYGQFWYVTITGYGKDIEPGVPDKKKVMEDFKWLSKRVGINSVGWRYDPIFVDEKYTVDYHLQKFQEMAANLDGYTNRVVISFIDIYEKVKRNFPEAKGVTAEEKMYLGQKMVEIAAAHDMVVKPCAEGDFLAKYGADCGGCMTIADYEKAIGKSLVVPKSKNKPARENCSCYITADIGAYDTCAHFCKYCYANNDINQVRINRGLHDVNSPLLIGNIGPDDIVTEAEQRSWVDNQMNIFQFI